MARINDGLLVQLVEAGPDDDEDVLVFVDESAGTEIVVLRHDWQRLMAALNYLTGGV